MSIARIRILAIAVALAGSGVAISLLQARTSDWKVGDVFVAIGKGKYEVRSNTGALRETIDTGTNKEVAGCWFDSQFNLYTADIYNTRVLKHLLASPSHTQSVFANTVLQAPDGHSKSIVMAVNGDVYVGNAGNNNGSGTQNILRYRSDGAFLGSFAPDTEGNGGIDWMDLATDQRTMFYTSRGRFIKKFDVGTALDPVPGIPQLQDFADLTSTTPTGQAFAIRLLPPFDKNASGGLLVADNVNIKRLSSTGAVVATWDYDVQGTNNDENAWQSLNLDPDGVHFWALGTSTGRLFRFSLNNPGDPNPADNNPGTNTHDLGPIQTAGNGTSAGVCIMGEPQTQIQPLVLSTGPADVTTRFGDPLSFGNNVAFYSFSSWRLRINVSAGPIVAAVSFTPQSTTLACESDDENDPNDFDCRFKSANLTSPTQCVPFFRDPSATPASGTLAALERYRCGYYRVKDMPDCTAFDGNGNCTAPFAEKLVPGSNDVQGEILMDLTNPPTPTQIPTPPGFFDVSIYGPPPKGNPRLMRDPDSVNMGNDTTLANQFFIDATTAVIDWPAFGTGTPNDYSPVQRVTSESGSCAVFISPAEFSGQNSGSSMKVIIEVRHLDQNGACTGAGIPGASTGLNNLTLAISGGPPNPPNPFASQMPIIFCETPGSSLGCFTPVNGQDGRYQSTVDLTNPPFFPSSQFPYFFSVTSVNVPSSILANQNPGIFPPIGRSFFICPNGSNCGKQ